MTWANPTDDLRRLLNDDAQGNLVKEKQVFPTRGGEADGLTNTFFTFEDRLVSSGVQSAATYPLRVFLLNRAAQSFTEVSASGINVRDAVRGEFTVFPTPSGVIVKASYYWQQHLGDDLDFFLEQGAAQCNSATVGNVVGGLQMACLDFAASYAHRKLAQRWAYRKTQQFLLEDAPSSDMITGLVDFHSDQAKEFLKDAIAARKAFYDERLGAANAPASKIFPRTPRPYTPRR